VLLAWALYYYFACESGAGQTLGKRLLKLRVVRADGRPAGIREIAVRTVLRVVDMQFAYLVGLIVMLATGERRGRLGDLAAGTMIVSTEATATPMPTAPAAPAAGPVVAAPEPTPDLTSPSPKELARDVTAATGSARVEEDAPAHPLALPLEEAAPGDEAALPAVAAEISVDRTDAPVEEIELAAREAAVPARPVDQESEVTVRSVETVSAIDLVMGADEPGAGAPAANEPPQDAGPE
jgi:hypothetical protein